MTLDFDLFIYDTKRNKAFSIEEFFNVTKYLETFVTLFILFQSISVAFAWKDNLVVFIFA